MTDWNLRPGVVLAEVYGVYLLAADSEARKCCGYVRRVNSIGALIWKMMSEGKDREEILLAMTQEYVIPEGHDPEDDLDFFICSLRDNHYIVCEAFKNEV